MGKFSISIIFAFTILIISGCSSRRSDVEANIKIGGELLYGLDKSPLRQAVIYRKSDGKAFLTDNSGKFNIEAHPGDSLKFSFVGTISRTLPVSECDTSMIVLLDPYIPGNDEHTYSERYFGKYVQRSDGSTLTITKADEGRYNVLIDLFRLTQIDNAIGRLIKGMLVFTGTDASGDQICGEITVNEDSAILKITRSTWEYLPTDSTFTFERETVADISPQKSYSTADGMTMKIVKPNPVRIPVDSLVVEFTNNRNENLTTGEWYMIEFLSDAGDWKQAPYSKRYLELKAEGTEICFNAIGYTIQPETSFQITEKPWFYDLSNKAATYRLVKTFSYPPYPIQKSDTAYVEFQIK